MDFNSKRVDRVLEDIGWEYRADSNETFYVKNQLRAQLRSAFAQRFPSLKGERLVPVNSTASPGAAVLTYSQLEEVGEAKVIANHGDDIPYVDVSATEETTKVKQIGLAYKYSLNDLETGQGLRENRATACLRGMRQKLDKVALVGDSVYGISGFFNHPNLGGGAALTLPNAGVWSALTATQVLENMHFLSAAIYTNTNEVFSGDTMVLPTSVAGALLTKFNTQTDRTVVDIFLANDPYVSNIETSPFLEPANSGLADTRVICYPRSPDVLQQVITLTPRAVAPQAENFYFKVPMRAKTAGTQLYFPTACVYAEAI